MLTVGVAPTLHFELVPTSRVATALSKEGKMKKALVAALSAALVRQAEVACKKGDMAQSSAKAKEALGLLK